MILFTMLLAGLWGGVIWRARGGAFTTIFHLDPGTGGMRAIAALAFALPMAIANSWYMLLLVPAFWIGWSISGWGAFQGVGHSPVETSNPVARMLDHLGIAHKLTADLLGLAIEGLICLLIPSLVVGWVTGSPLRGLMFWWCGLLFAPCYWLGWYLKPDLGEFAHANSEWGEVYVGAVVGAALFICGVWAVQLGS